MGISTGNGKLCSASRRDGKPCQAYALAESDFCFAHDPELQDEREEARSRGGKARHNRTIRVDTEQGQVTFQSTDDVLAYLELAASDLASLENSVSRARAMTYLASVASDLLRATDLEDRIRQLEDERYTRIS